MRIIIAFIAVATLWLAAPTEARSRAAVKHDRTPPTVQLTAPADGATVSGPMSLSATAQDNVAVDHVTFRVDGTYVGEDHSSPYSIFWDSTSVADGTHVITARAADTAGNTSSLPDPSATVTVQNAVVTPTPTPTPTPTATPSPTPTPGPTVLFSESFDSPLCAPDVWGTNPWISGACPRPEIQGDSNESIIYSVVDPDRSSNVGWTGSHTDNQHWWTYSVWSDPAVRISAYVKPIGWDSTADTWSEIAFYLHRVKAASNASFYGLIPYEKDGHYHIEKKCVGPYSTNSVIPDFEHGTLNDGQPYAYYLLDRNTPTRILPQFGHWHLLEATAVNQPDGSVVLTLFVDGAQILQATDYPGYTGCAPLLSGGTGWRSDHQQYEIDNLTLVSG